MNCCDENGLKACEYFRSYQEIYDNDPEEPLELGICVNIISPRYQCGGGYDVGCEYYQKQGGEE